MFAIIVACRNIPISKLLNFSRLSLIPPYITIYLQLLWHVGIFLYLKCQTLAGYHCTKEENSHIHHFTFICM